MRLEPLRDRLNLPILVINDSPIKQFAENEHAVGQSKLESYLRLTNRVTNGEKITVFGYGACGRGVAASFRGACARVTVVDVNPVTRLRAHLDGFSTPPRDEAIADADVIITVTGARDVLTWASRCRHGAWRPSPTAAWTPAAASFPSRAGSTPRSPAATSIASTRPRRDRLTRGHLRLQP